MARPHVADGVTASDMEGTSKILNKSSRTSDEGWSSSQSIEVNWSQVKSGEIRLKSGEVKRNQVKSIQVNSSQVKSSQVKPSQSKPRHARPRNASSRQVTPIHAMLRRHFHLFHPFRASFGASVSRPVFRFFSRPVSVRFLTGFLRFMSGFLPLSVMIHTEFRPVSVRFPTGLRPASYRFPSGCLQVSIHFRPLSVRFPTCFR